jgi:hypothetical protein
VTEALAEFKGGGEALAGQLAFAEAQVGESAEVETVGLAPGVLAVGRFRPVERFAGFLERLAGVAGGKVCFGEREADVDGVFSEPAGISQAESGFAFRNCLLVVSQVSLEFASCVETAKLEFDIAGTVCERKGVLKVPGRLGGIAQKEEPHEKRVAKAKIVVIVAREGELPVALCLVEGFSPVSTKELALRLVDARKASNQGFVAQLCNTLKIRQRKSNVAQGEVRGRSISKGVACLGIVIDFRGEQNPTLRIFEGLWEVSRVQFNVSEILGASRFLLGV